MTSEPEERMRFGRYETLFRIAEGGMAAVFAARALGEGGFQKLVALKRMRPELAQDSRFVTMFLDEGRLAANIASPNVVSTLDLGRAEDHSLFLVMELVVGVSLQHLMHETILAEEPLPIPIAVAILAQAASGLHDAHEARSPLGERLEIIHRDCSPHNILIDVNGQVKITDFGIAKAMERQTQSQAGEMKGKLAYLSPEQARGMDVDQRVDIFILGVVAWEVLAGQRLFVAETPIEALVKVSTMPIPHLSEIDPSIPAGVADAVAKALEREPEDRFSSAADFGQALRLGLDETPPSRAEVGALVRKHGREPLTKLQEGIRAAMRAAGMSPSMAPPMSPSVPPPASRPPSASGPDAMARTLSSAFPPPPALPRELGVPPDEKAWEPTREGRTVEGHGAPTGSPPSRSRSRTAALPGSEPPPRSASGRTLALEAPTAVDSPPATLEREQKTSALPLILGAAAVIIISVGVGAFAAYWREPPEPPTSGVAGAPDPQIAVEPEDTEDVAQGSGELDDAPARGEAEEGEDESLAAVDDGSDEGDAADEPTAEEGRDARRAAEAVASRERERRAQQAARRDRPVPGTTPRANDRPPSTVGGDTPLLGDRAAAFAEIEEAARRAREQERRRSER